MATFTSWTEGILLSLAFVAVFTVAIVSMNLDYGQVHSIGLNDSSGSQSYFVEYQESSQNKIQSGDVETNQNQGVILKNSYGLITDLISIMWGFISGGWIGDTIAMLNLGVAGTLLAFALRIIYFVSVVGVLLYALFKTNL